MENDNLKKSINLENTRNSKNTGNSENKNTEQDELSPECKKWLNRFTFIFGVYILFLLSVFIIPTDILDKCQICASFTNFMKQFIPSIEIFGSTSKIPQVVMFYTGYIYVIFVILFLILFFSVLFLSMKYSNGVCYKNFKLKHILYTTFVCAVIYYIHIRLYFCGNLVLEKVGIFAKDFYPTMSSRFEILFWTFLAHGIILFFGAVFFPVFLSDIINNIKNQINKFF